MSARSLARGITVAALLWCAILLLAPLALARGGPRLAAPAALVYQAAGLICHQRPERSFHAAGVQLPVCARCFGLYAAGAAGALAGWAAMCGRRQTSRDRMGLIVCAAPTAVTFGLEVLGLAHPSNSVRAAAAVPLGLAAGFLFVQSLRTESAREVHTP